MGRIKTAAEVAQIGPLHKYLGHFKNPEVLNAGHNTGGIMESLFGKKKSLYEQDMEREAAKKAAPPPPAAPAPKAPEEKDKSKRRKSLDEQIEKGGGD